MAFVGGREAWNPWVFHYLSYFSSYPRPFLPSLPHDGWPLLFNSICMWTKVQTAWKAIQWNELPVTPLMFLEGSHVNTFLCFLPNIFFPVFVHSLVLYTNESSPTTLFCIFGLYLFFYLTLHYSILSNTKLDYLEHLGQKMGRELRVQGREWMLFRI